MAKWLKKVLGVAAVGGAAAGALYYWKKNMVDTAEFEDDFEDEDFDLDDDLKPASDREYVSLGSAAKAAEDAVENAAEKAKDIAEDVKEEAKDIAEDVKEEAKDIAEDVKEKAKDIVS